MHKKVLLNFKTKHGDNIMLLIIIIIRLVDPIGDIRITTILSGNVTMMYPIRSSVDFKKKKKKKIPAK